MWVWVKTQVPVLGHPPFVWSILKGDVGGHQGFDPQLYLLPETEPVCSQGHTPGEAALLGRRQARGLLTFRMDKASGFIGGVENHGLVVLAQIDSTNWAFSEMLWMVVKSVRTTK